MVFDLNHNETPTNQPCHECHTIWIFMDPPKTGGTVHLYKHVEAVSKPYGSVRLKGFCLPIIPGLPILKHGWDFLDPWNPTRDIWVGVDRFTGMVGAFLWEIWNRGHYSTDPNNAVPPPKTKPYGYSLTCGWWWGYKLFWGGSESAIWFQALNGRVSR